MGIDMHRILYCEIENRLSVIEHVSEKGSS